MSYQEFSQNRAESKNQIYGSKSKSVGKLQKDPQPLQESGKLQRSYSKPPLRTPTPRRLKEPEQNDPVPQVLNKINMNVFTVQESP